MCFLRNTEVVALSPFLSTCTSRNAIFWSSSFSIVNWMAGCCEFRWFRNSSRALSPCGQMAKTSSTYLIQRLGFCADVSKARFSNASMYRLATMGDRGEPIEMNHTRRKVIEAIHIKKQKVTSNLDCGRSLSPVWQPLLCPP